MRVLCVPHLDFEVVTAWHKSITNHAPSCVKMSKLHRVHSINGFEGI